MMRPVSPDLLQLHYEIDKQTPYAALGWPVSALKSLFRDFAVT